MNTKQSESKVFTKVLKATTAALCLIGTLVATQTKADTASPTPFEQTLIQRALAKGFSFSWASEPEQMTPTRTWAPLISKTIRLRDIKFRGVGIDIISARKVRSAQIYELCKDLFVDERDGRYSFAIGERLDHKLSGGTNPAKAFEIAEVACELILNRPTDKEDRR